MGTEDMTLSRKPPEKNSLAEKGKERFRTFAGEKGPRLEGRPFLWLRLIEGRGSGEVVGGTVDFLPLGILRQRKKKGGAGGSGRKGFPLPVRDDWGS